MELLIRLFAPFARLLSHVWSMLALVSLHLREDTRAGYALATKLALEVHWTSNLSEFPLRVAFARAVLRSSMSSRPRLEDYKKQE